MKCLRHLLGGTKLVRDRNQLVRDILELQITVR